MRLQGPDGFNNDFFLKKCWQIIVPDFYNLYEHFQRRDLCLQSINSSYITLLSKVENLCKVGDYRTHLTPELLYEVNHKTSDSRGDHGVNTQKLVWLYQDKDNTKLPSLVF